jgi:hypothetical protein
MLVVQGWFSATPDEEHFYFFPRQARRRLFTMPIKVHSVMANGTKMLGQVGHDVVDETAQQILAVDQFS